MAEKISDKTQIQKHRWLILTAVSLFTFMSTLDSSIVNIALPVMSKSMQIPMNQTEWVVSVYLIVICALLLLFGKISDIKGKVRIFKIGSYIFTISSFLSGLNLGLSVLLVSRALQALGAAMTMSTNNGIITEVFPLNERGRALGMIGSFVALGTIAGPGIGGLILTHLSWGFIFWINVPVGIVAIIIGQYILPVEKISSSTSKSVDWWGALSFAVAIVSLFIGIFVGQEIGFGKLSIIALFIVAVISFLSFYYIERHVENPLLSFSLFKNSRFSVSTLCAFLIFVIMFFFTAIAPFYLENALRMPTNLAGLVLMISPIFQVIVAPIAGAISDRIGAEVLTFIGLIFVLISQIGYMMTGLKTPLLLFAVFIALFGLGNGIFQAPNNSVIMSSVPVKSLGVAGGISALARNLGMVIGISGATTVLFSTMSHIHGSRVTTFLAHDPQLFISGMHVVFGVALALCLIAIGLTGWRLITRK